MSKSGLMRIGAWVGGLLVSYVACFEILVLPLHTFSMASRLGLLCALVCSVGANVYYWAGILSTVAKKRGWSARGCQKAGLLVIIPGTILYLARGFDVGTTNVLIQDAIWTGFFCARLVYPNFLTMDSYERDAPVTLSLK